MAATGGIAISRYTDADRASVIALWRLCGLTRPWNDPDKDIGRKLTDPAGVFLVAKLRGEIVGSVMAGYDGHRGSVNYLAVHPEHRRAGIGRRLMAEVEAALLALGCPKINLLVRRGNSEALEFYEKLGYLSDDVTALGKRLIADH